MVLFSRGGSTDHRPPAALQQMPPYWHGGVWQVCTHTHTQHRVEEWVCVLVWSQSELCRSIWWNIKEADCFAGINSVKWRSSTLLSQWWGGGEGYFMWRLHKYLICPVITTFNVSPAATLYCIFTQSALYRRCTSFSSVIWLTCRLVKTRRFNKIMHVVQQFPCLYLAGWPWMCLTDCTWGRRLRVRRTLSLVWWSHTNCPAPIKYSR